MTLDDIKRSTLFAITLAFVTAMAISTPTHADLPAVLKEELNKIEKKIERVRATAAKGDKTATDLDVRETKQWIKEFALDAELFDDDPMIVALYKNLEDASKLSNKVASDKEEMERQKTAKSSEMMDGQSVSVPDLKLEVDLSNVSFKKDVAPIVFNACGRCHNAQRKSGDFNASTYASFMEMIEPGKPDESHVLALVTGKEEPRMPQGGQVRFPEEWVEIWSKWIEQGAKFDGPNPNAPLNEYMIDFDTQRRQLLAKMSTPDLQKLHKSYAERDIKIVNPKAPVARAETKNFLVYTTRSQEDAEYIGVLGEAVLESLLPRFGKPKTELVWRGRLALNVFADRTDFIAFAREVDDYDPTSSEVAVTRLKPEHQYIAIDASAPGISLDGLVAQEVTTAFVMDLGNRRLPPWVAYGYARLIASEFDSRSPTFRDELKTAYQLARVNPTLEGLLWERRPWGELAPLGASLFQFLEDNRVAKQKMAPFIQQIANTGNVQQAVQQALGVTPDQLSQAWAGWMSQQR